MATRDEKTAVSFTGVLCLAATRDWIKGRQALVFDRIFHAVYKDRRRTS
ncbi:hypothetical protein Mnod_2018 [Methylobacterium nodulans ORS 2060]|uniref:Uncharacterized protein n=1 Tax=Methylobacterium nodulans (strain LMG 21967 / CNCM I-2342 / ORS 2060) TaxID=460265 RepID=B8ITB8_METNO|nr:hypothetical protein Mnod_2018 [Methylobacterium nodulans ORS 2060]